MQATLTWLDLTASDRDKMRRVLDLFKEQGTLDEMGLGSLRDAQEERRSAGPTRTHGHEQHQRQADSRFS